MLVKKQKLKHSVLLCVSVILLGSEFFWSSVHASETSLAEKIAFTEAFLQEVRHAIQNGDDLETTDSQGNTVLINALTYTKRLIVASTMLEAGTDYQVTRSELGKRVDEKCTLRRKLINILLQARPDLEYTNKNNETALIIAVKNKDNEIIPALLHRGAKPPEGYVRQATLFVYQRTVIKKDGRNIGEAFLPPWSTPPQPIQDGLRTESQRLLKQNMPFYGAHLKAAEKFVSQGGRTSQALTQLIIKDFAGHSEFESSKIK